MKIIKKIIVWVLTIEARLILKKYKPFIIAVTGSVGKTGTKDAIYSVLENQSRYVRKSEKSMNSEIGLPLTLIGAPNAWHNIRGWWQNIVQGLQLIIRKNEYPDLLILEIGADHPGDIKRVAKWLHPNIAVLTRVSETPVHVEFFKSPAQVFEEKASLVRAVGKGGTAVLFVDDEKIVVLGEELGKKDISVVTFGLNEKASVRGADFAYDYIRDENDKAEDEILRKRLVSRFMIHLDGKNEMVTYKNPLGRTGMYPILAAAAVAKTRGMTFKDIVKGLGEYKAPKGRMNVLSGINDSTLIDDSYNSSPDAVEAALLTLREVTCSGKKIAVLGDMMELGKYSAEEHRKVGREVASAAQILVTVGQRSRLSAEEAQEHGLAADNIHSFDSSSEAISTLTALVKPNDIVLIKGSQSMRMERIVKALLKEPSKAGTLLVRQEEEWLRKV